MKTFLVKLRNFTINRNEGNRDVLAMTKSLFGKSLSLKNGSTSLRQSLFLASNCD